MDVLNPDSYYWCDRDGAGAPWRVGDRVGSGPGAMSEPAYADALNRVTPSAINNRCLQGVDIMRGSWRFKTDPPETRR